MSGANTTLPTGWSWSTLGELCHPPQYGWTTKAASEGTTRFLRTTDITKGPIDWPSVPFCAEAPEDKKKYLLQPGDIVASRAGSVGFSALIGDCPETVFASYLIRFRPVEPAMAPYLTRYMQSPEYWRAIRAEAVGIALSNVNAKKLAAIPVPVPPFREQQAIVEAIDHGFGLIDFGVSRFSAAGRDLVRFERSNYVAALSGDMASRSPTEESGAQLLTRIGVAQLPATERHVNWPAHWSVATLGDLSTRVTSGSRDWKPYYDRGTGVFVLSQSVRMRALDFTKSIHVDPPLDDPARARSVIARDDLLITIVGANVGNAARVVVQPEEHFVCQSLALVRLKELPMSSFLELYLTAPNGGQQYFETCFYGQGRPHISFPDIKNMPVPVPPLDEQARIVAEFEVQMAAAGQFRGTLGSAQRQATDLRRSLLHSTFYGRLTERISNGESAEALLERLGTMKASSPRQRKKHRAALVEE